MYKLFKNNFKTTCFYSYVIAVKNEDVVVYEFSKLFKSFFYSGLGQYDTKLKN